MRRFNNIINNQSDYEQLKYFLENNAPPPEITNKSRFIRKFQGFAKLGSKIIYQPLNLEVVPFDEKTNKLKEIFETDDNVVGKGIYGLFKYLQSKYIGFTRNDIQAFMESNSNYQMRQPLTTRTNKPIISKFPNQLWACDLIDMDAFLPSNYKWRYILNVVDIFSRKVWLARLKRKEATDVKLEFEYICERANVKPDYLISDNGKEWLGEFKKFCEDNDITQRFTRSYSPQANGVVERSNKDIRKIIRSYLIENNNLKWYNTLDKIEENKNNSYHSSVKGIPNTIWVANKDKLTNRNLPEAITENPRLKARLNIVKKALKEIKKFKETDNFEEGDVVRVKMSSIFANVRKALKAKEGKNIVITYTPELFRVRKVIVPRGVLERKRYTLENEDGKILTKNNTTVQFYASELLLWDGGDNDTEITMERSLELNKVGRNENDVNFE